MPQQAPIIRLHSLIWFVFVVDTDCVLRWEVTSQVNSLIIIYTYS